MSYGLLPGSYRFQYPIGRQLATRRRLPDAGNGPLADFGQPLASSRSPTGPGNGLGSLRSEGG